jgi:hypothetical protein
MMATLILDLVYVDNYRGSEKMSSMFEYPALHPSLHHMDELTR